MTSILNQPNEVTIDESVIVPLCQVHVAFKPVGSASRMIDTFCADSVFALRITMGSSLTNFPFFPAARSLTLESVMFVVVVAAVHILTPTSRT